MANFKTVKKWEEQFSCDLQKIFSNGKVIKLKCKTCIKFEKEITSVRGFSTSWIVGTDSVKKDSLAKHVAGDPHKYAADLMRKASLGAVAFNEHVIENTPIGRDL